MATDDAKWTRHGVAGGAVADGLATDVIFLSGEVKGHIVGLEDAGDRGGPGVEIGLPDGESDITAAEGM
jgi:hypothetical protein